MAYYGDRDVGAGPGGGLLGMLVLIILASVMTGLVVAQRVGLDGDSVGATLFSFLAPPLFSRPVDDPSRDRPLLAPHTPSADQIDVAGARSPVDR